MKSAEFFFPERHIVSTHRPVQLQMAHTVETALNVGGIALIEAKTGTGKSMGYSIPAAVYLNDFYKTKPKQVRKMSGLLTPEGQDVYHTPRIIISTAKKSLQTQLMQKDLPHITKHIEAVSYAVLKGKNNYICKVRHNDFIDPSRIIRNQREYNYRDIEQYTTWASQTTTGDLTEINYPFLFRVGVTECLKKACTFKNNCYYLDQKDTFKNAAIGITNHSFLAYEVLLGRTRLFGIYDQLIIDEAHSLVQAVREAFSTTITNKFPSQLKRNFSVMLGDHSVDELEGHFIRLFNYLSLQPEGELSINRNLYDLVLPTIESILELKQSAQKIIKPFLSSDANIDNPWEVDFSGFSELAIAEANAILSMAYGLKLIDKALSALRRGIGINPEETLIKELLDQNKITQEAADKYLENRANMNYAVHLRTNNAFQGSEKQIEFRTDPVEVGPMLGPFLKNMHSVVITSATLANDGDFEYSLRQLGLTSADVPYQQALPHVFDYARQSMIYINDTMPPPDFYRGSVSKDIYYDQISQACHELLQASGGGAFILTSNWNDVREINKRLLNIHKQSPAEYTVMTQSRNPQADVAQFKTGCHNVLIATKSLWEGVDVQGLGLRMVIITKLPFPPEQDIILKKQKEAMIKHYVQNGKDEKGANMIAFSKLCVAAVAIEIAQGGGRLIRSTEDRGILAILDSRMGFNKTVAKGYAETLRKALPIYPSNRRDQALELAKLYRKKAEKNWKPNS